MMMMMMIMVRRRSFLYDAMPHICSARQRRSKWKRQVTEQEGSWRSLVIEHSWHHEYTRIDLPFERGNFPALLG